MKQQNKQQSPEQHPEILEPSAASPNNTADKTGPQNAKERFYDKIPLSYKQVDILVKVMLAVLALAIIIGIVQGNR